MQEFASVTIKYFSVSKFVRSVESSKGGYRRLVDSLRDEDNGQQKTPRKGEQKASENREIVVVLRMGLLIMSRQD